MSVQCERLSLVIVREMSSVMIERTTLWNCRLEGGDNSSLGELALFCIFVFFLSLGALPSPHEAFENFFI